MPLDEFGGTMCCFPIYRPGCHCRKLVNIEICMAPFISKLHTGYEQTRKPMLEMLIESLLRIFYLESQLGFVIRAYKVCVPWKIGAFPHVEHVICVFVEYGND